MGDLSLSTALPIDEAIMTQLHAIIDEKRSFLRQSKTSMLDSKACVTFWKSQIKK